MPQYNIKQVKGSTQGSILFLGNNGVVSENNSQLFWSPTQSSLSIGTTTFVSGEKLRILGNQRIDGNLIVSGSFSVLGSASIINTQNLTIQDPIILLASTQSGAPTLDSGLFINRGTGATQAFIWDESDSKFVVIQTNDGANAIGNVNISSGAQIRALRYNFFDSGSPAAAASATINAPSGGSIALNAASSVQFITPQLASSAQVTSWDIGANTLEFGGSNTRSFKLGVADSAGTTPTFMFYSTSAGNSGTVRTGMSFSHVVGSQFANVLERGFVIETRDGGTYSGTAVGLTIDVTGVTNSNRFKYGLRILDGRQSNGYVLVSDSNGFSSWTSSSSVLSSANGVTGSGIINYVPRWTSANNLSATGSIYDSGVRFGVGLPSANYSINAFNGTNFGPGGTTVSKVFIDGSANSTFSTVLFVDGPSSNSVTGGHVAYFRRNLDAAGATASVLTLENTNRGGGTPGASTFRTISGSAGKLSQFQALSGGQFSMGNTFSSTSTTLLALTMDTNTFQDPGNVDRWMFRGIDNMDSINTSSNRYGISVVMGGTYAPQAVGSTRLYGIYSDVSGVGSTSSTASVIAGVFLGGNVGVGLNNPAARLHVSGTSMAQPLIIASGSSTGDLVRITHTGTGNSFVVEDSANPDSTQFVIDANGNVGIGLTAPAVKLHVINSTRVSKVGTYSYNYSNVSSSIEGVYFTSSISNSMINTGVFGVSRPTGLTSNTLSTYAGVIGSVIWERDTSFVPSGLAGIANVGKLYGVIGQIYIAATPSGSTAQGGAGVNSLVSNQYAGTTVSTLMNYRADWVGGGSSPNQGYVGNYYGYYQVPSGAAAQNVGNRWGVYVDDSLAANVFLGNMAIGTTTSATSSTFRLIVSGTTSTTALRVTGGAVAGYTLISDASGNATWTNPGSTGLTGSVTTTNATNTLMVGCSASIPTGNAMTAWAYVIGKSPSGATSAVGGRVEGVFRNVAGVLTSVGVSSNISEDFSSGNPSFTLVSSGTYVTVQVTGFVGATISWYGTMKYNLI